MLELVKYAAIALLLSLIITPGVIKLAFKVGAIDKPNSRKVHARVMPRLGGLAIFAAFALPAMLALDFNRQFIGLLLGGVVILVLGVMDDLKDISPKVKLAGQLVAALILIGFGTKVENLTNPFGSDPIHLGWLSIPVTVFWIVGVTNAVNLVDGLDGLAAGIAAIAAATLGLVAMENDPAITLVAFTLVGAILGFMRYNFNPARIFMGDSGSLFLGYTLAGLAIMGLAKSATVFSLFIPVLVLGVPILDTLFAIIRRIVNDQPIFQADKAHLHHCLLASGLSHRQTVLVIYLIHGALSGVAVLLNELTTTQGMLILLGISVVTLIGANRLGVMGRLPQPQEANTKSTTIGG
ncbi:MAG: MraY family glycosyltransferase [Clostridia bacterium]|nr:MraY family glycosyltransferase [Clostridia bacterium]